MKLTQRDAIVLALKARGEQQIEDRTLTKWWKFTCRFNALRAKDGQLTPVPDHLKGYCWFVSRSTGAMRVGVKSTTSRAVRREARFALVLEGQRVAKEVAANA